jgi:glycosyltransferase involved in cell wall biosynthesis
MKIGIISLMDIVEWGGSEELWYAMAERALKRGIAVTVCILRPRGEHPKWKALQREGAQLFSEGAQDSYAASLRYRIAARTDLLGARMAAAVRDRLSPLRPFFATRPDVVLISDGASIPKRETIGILMTHLATQPYIILSEANLGEIPETSLRKAAAAYYRNAHYALFVAHDSIKATERQILERLPNARVVRNPVNLESLEPVAWPQTPTLRFASVARLFCLAKGQDILFAALSDGRWRDRDWHLSLYGTGPDESYLRELARFYAIDDRVSFCGQVEDIRAVWKSHHACLQPSRFEGTPLAMVEAMICGRPVIGTAVAGIPEWVQEGHSGFIAPSATADSYADTLERAWERREEWSAIGKDAREVALRLHDPNPGETLLSLVIEAAESRRGA